MTLREPKVKKLKVRQRAKNLSMVVRQTQIAKLILKDPLSLTPELVAEKLKVSLSTAKRDLQDPEIHKQLREALLYYASGDLTRKALDNIAAGIESEDIELSKWFLERSQFFPSERMKIDGKITTQVELGEDLAAILEAAMEDPKVRKKIMKGIAPPREDKVDGQSPRRKS